MNESKNLKNYHNEFTPSKLEQDEIEKSEERYRSTLDHMLEGCQILGFDWCYLYINASAEKHNRRPNEELLGKKYMDMWPGIELTEVFMRIKHCMEERIVQLIENEFIFPDGTIGWFKLSIQPIPEGVFILSQDITEYKHTMEKLCRSEAYFHTLYESSPDCIIVVNASGEIESLNQRTQCLFGYTKEELIGKLVEILIPHCFKSHDILRRNYTSNPEVRPMGTGKELFAKHKNGTEFPVEISLSPIQMNNNFNVIATVRDITEKKKLEQQFLRNQRMESIGTLAGGIAHDLNNILTPVLLYLDIIKMKLTDEKSQKILQMLESSLNRGTNLIKQVLSFARGIEGERTILQISQLIDEIEKIINETFPKSISFCTGISKNLPTLSADSTQIHQVLMNLCVNARDAMPNGGKIDIKAETIILDEQYVKMNLDAKLGQYVIITVSDQGMGIPPEIKERIFEPFFTTKEIGKGTGLGLSTTFSIIKNHNGFINVYSEVGKGTTFKVYLPTQEDTVVFVTEEKETYLTGNGELILVVDDEMSIREITKTTLETYGYSVLTAEDGTEAIAIYAVHGQKIALVLTDIMMPYMDGTALVRAIQKMNPNTKFVVVSGFKQSIDIVKQDSVVFLEKPYTSKNLLKTISEILQRK